MQVWKRAEPVAKAMAPAGGERPRRGGLPTRLRAVLGTLAAVVLVASAASAQGILQGMRGCLRAVPAVFGACDGNPETPCNLHYEIWSDVYSGEVNRDVSGEAVCTASTPGGPLLNCCTGISVAANYPTAGRDPGKDWFVQWFGERFPGEPGHIGYYAAQSQIVNFGEFGNWNRFDCIGSLPIACFRPAGPAGSPAPAGHSVTRADGTVEAPLGSLSPIPIPRAGLDKQNLQIALDWDAATGVVITDDAEDPITGYRVWMAEDTDWDQTFPEPDVLDYRRLVDVPVSPFTPPAISIPENLNPHSEAVRFAVQILYRSTPNPNPFFERRSGYAIPEAGFLRVEGLSANGNLIDLGLLALIRNFSGAYAGGNRVRLSWEVTTENVPFLEFFEVLVAKSAEGLDVGTLPGRLAEGTLGPIAFVPGQTAYETVDRNAGRAGSKINLYVLQAVFENGARATSDPIVVDLTDILDE